MPRAPVASPIERVPARRLSGAESSVKLAPQLVVRSARPGEIDSRAHEDLQRALGIGMGVGAVAIGEAAVLPFMMFSPGALLGGIVVTIGAASMLSAEQAVQQRLVQAVSSAGFEERIRRALESRLDHAQGAEEADATLEIVVLAHGVVEDRPRRVFCVFADLAVTLRRGGEEVYADRILILPTRRSVDAPVPDCRLRATLARNEGTLVGEALQDYAAALPSILVRRLPGLPWRE